MNALNKKTVDDINVKGQKVLVRCDFNVPLKNGVIADENRINAALPTIKKLIADGGKVILCSHLGRPKGEFNPEFSLAPVAVRLSELLGKETIDTNTFGKSTGRSGNYSTNYQISGRELLTPDEVRMLDNQYAILFIRGERPVMDFKYDILKHPNVALTTDGKASAYKHGEVTIKHSSISVLSIDPEELPEESYGETNYELLSDEDFEVNKNLF